MVAAFLKRARSVTTATAQRRRLQPGCVKEERIECGNGVLEEGEECDDGNKRDGDGCNRACARASELR